MSYCKQFVFICTVCAYLNSCESITKTPADFSFVIENELDSYNSETNIFTRKYVGKDTTVIVALDSTELIQLYKEFIKYDFVDFPEKVIGFTYILPASTTTIIYKQKNKFKCYSHTTDTDYPLLQRIYEVNFIQLENKIWARLRNKKSIGSLKKSDIVFF